MSSKSTSQRNERILLELRGREGNDACADCGGRQPRWASWNLGIWLCVKCATIHRRMGTHISRVKSASLDIWTKEQVASMRDNGNIKSNMLYNPNPRMHPPPLDLESEHAESQLERYIFQKYRDKAFMERPKKKRADLDSPSTSAIADSRTPGADASVAIKSEGRISQKNDEYVPGGIRTPEVSITKPQRLGERALSPPLGPSTSQQPPPHPVATLAATTGSGRAMTAPLPDQGSRSFSPATSQNQHYNPFNRQMTASAQIPSTTSMPTQTVSPGYSGGLAPYQHHWQPMSSSSSNLQTNMSSMYGQMPMHKPASMPQVQSTPLQGEVWQDLAGLSISGGGASTQQPISGLYTGSRASSIPLMQTNPFLQSSMMSARAPSQLSSMSSGSSFSSLGSHSSAGASPMYTQVNLHGSSMPSYQYQAAQTFSTPLFGNAYTTTMPQQQQHQAHQHMTPTASTQYQQQIPQVSAKQQQLQNNQFHSSNPYASQFTQLQHPYPQYVQNQYQSM